MKSAFGLPAASTKRSLGEPHGATRTVNSPVSFFGDQDREAPPLSLPFTSSNRETASWCSARGGRLVTVMMRCSSTDVGGVLELYRTRDCGGKWNQGHGRN